jgi:hypothetical protein
LYDTPDDFIDLTNSFDSTPTMEEVKNFLRESAATGKKFETSSPDYFLDVLDSSKKIDHIAKSSKFKTMNKAQKKRHNKYVLAFDDISKTLKKKGEGVENTKPDKKPNVKNYHEFNTTAKFNENNYPLTVYAEQLINEPDTIPQTYHLYDILENKKSPSANSLKSVNLGDDTNIITNNLDNFNPSAGLYEKIVDKNEVFYTPWNTEIIKNATSNQKQDLIREYRKQTLNNLKGDDPVFRTTYDKDGNEYIWRAADDVHYNIENYLLDKLGIQANQNVYDLNRDILKQYRNNPEEYYNLSKKLRDYENDVMFGRFRGSFENYKKKDL